MFFIEKCCLFAFYAFDWLNTSHLFMIDLCAFAFHGYLLFSVCFWSSWGFDFSYKNKYFEQLCQSLKTVISSCSDAFLHNFTRNLHIQKEINKLFNYFVFLSALLIILLLLLDVFSLSAFIFFLHLCIIYWNLYL